MFSKIRNALSGSSSDPNSRNFSSGKSCLSPKFPYSRPHFLALSEDQVQASADHRSRPIITPNHGMSFLTGYAECINAGKSKWNEDQAVSHHGVLKSGNFVMPYKFYALFDGHAGVGASICAANQMHHVVHERLVDTQDDIWTDFLDSADPQKRNLLVIGALEAAFREMDDIIKGDRVTLQSSGGCTAIVAIFLLGQLFVANAGDSRAIVCKGFGFQAMSTDFTPESDRSRIRQLAQAKPELLGNDFTYMEYIRQPRPNDLGKRILYRDAFMTGWAHKTIVAEDLKISIITGQGKRSRVMGTIGVTRGFGDHELVSVHQKVPIKPFLSCHPEVKVYNLTDCSSYDVLVMGTDGLWDVVDGHMVTQIVNYATDNFPKKEMCPTAAACLVGAARGSLKENCWMMKSGKFASVDDISVFVIPLYPCSRLTYKLRKHVLTEGESDGASMDDIIDNSSVEEVPAGSTTSLDSASSDDYSVLLQTQANVPKVKICGVSFSESNKSEILLQEDECEDEEIEEEIGEPLSTDDTEDAGTDETESVSNKSSDKTELIPKSGQIGQFSGTSSETPSASYTIEATSQVPPERAKPYDESSEDELNSTDERTHSHRYRKEKQHTESVSGAFNTLMLDSEQQRYLNRPIGLDVENDFGTSEAQPDVTGTVEAHIGMQREYQTHSDRNLYGRQNIRMESYVDADSKSQYLVQDTTKTVSSSTVCASFIETDYESHSTISEDTPLTPGRKLGSASSSIPEDTPLTPGKELGSSSFISEDKPLTPSRELGSSRFIIEDEPLSPDRELENSSSITEDSSSIIPDSSASSEDINLLVEPVTFKEKLVKDSGIRSYEYLEQERKQSPAHQKHHRDSTSQMHSLFRIDPFLDAVPKQELYAVRQTFSDRRTSDSMQGSSKSLEHGRENVQSLEPKYKTEYTPILKSPELKRTEKILSPEPICKTEYSRVSRSPVYMQRAADTRSAEAMYETENTCVLKSPELKQRERITQSPLFRQTRRITQSPELERRTEHTRVSELAEYGKRTEDTRLPELRRSTEQPRVSHSPDYMHRYEGTPESDVASFIYEIETNPERMRQLQMLEQVPSQQEIQRQKLTGKLIMPVRSMSPPTPQVHTAYRQRTNSLPSGEMVKPDPSRREQQMPHKQYSLYTATTSREVKISPPCQQERMTTCRTQVIPPEVAIAEREIRAHEQKSTINQSVFKSKSKVRLSKDVLEAAKWEFYSDCDESD